MLDRIASEGPDFEFGPWYRSGRDMHVPQRCLQGETPESLQERLEPVLPLRIEEARRVCAHVVQRGNVELDGVKGLRKVARAAIEENLAIGTLRVVERVGSTLDPFMKYLFQLRPMDSGSKRRTHSVA